MKTIDEISDEIIAILAENNIDTFQILISHKNKTVMNLSGTKRELVEQIARSISMNKTAMQIFNTAVLQSSIKILKNKNDD